MGEVQLSTDFQTRLFEKIRADIGQLMSDDEVKKLVATAFERTFFQPEQVAKGVDGYSREPKYEVKPPMIQQIAMELLRPSVEKAIATWIAAHEQETHKIIEERVGASLTEAIAKAVNQIFGSAFTTLQYDLAQRITSIIQQNR